MLFLVKRITLQPGANHTWGSPAQKEGNFTETVLTEFSVERFPVDEFSLEGTYICRSRRVHQCRGRSLVFLMMIVLAIAR